jgi:zinc transport system ATP-binding protein
MRSEGSDVEQPVLLRCDGLTVGYGGRAILPPVDLELRRGQRWAVLGRNGAGKTTFFKTLLGLVPAIDGSVARPSGDIRIAYLAQRLSFDDLYPLQVRSIATDGTIQGWSFLQPRRAATRDVVERAMQSVGVAHLADRPFRSLSGGQKQRVLLARMLAAEPALVLLDEPTAGLDAVAEREVLDLLESLRKTYDLTVIVVTHTLWVAREAERVLFLDPDDQTVIAGTAQHVFSDPTFVARYGAVLEGRGGRAHA